LHEEKYLSNFQAEFDNITIFTAVLIKWPESYHDSYIM